MSAPTFDPDAVQFIADTYADINRRCFSGGAGAPDFGQADLWRRPRDGCGVREQILTLRADVVSAAKAYRLLRDLLMHEMVHEYCDHSQGLGYHSNHEGVFRTVTLNISPRYGVAPPDPGEAEFWPMRGRREDYYQGVRF